MSDGTYVSTRSFVGTAVLPSGLPELFSYTDARRHGLSDRQLRNLSEQGTIERIGRGLFGTTTLDADPDLIEVAFRSERATICLTSALARHELTDEIPATIDLALPRGTRRPATSAPITWHKFAPRTFNLGREALDVGAGYRIGLYSAERSICDASASAIWREASRRSRRSSVGSADQAASRRQLLALAATFGPKASEPIRSAPQIVL